MLGIYYLSYAAQPFPKSNRKLIIGYTKQGLLDKIEATYIPEDWICWFEECRIPKMLAQGNIEEVRAWIINHMPEKFKEPLRD